MPSATAIARGQRAAEAQMTGTFAAYSPTGHTAQDEDTGVESPTFDPEGSTPGKVQSRARQGDTQTRMVTIGGTERPVLEGGLHIPAAAFMSGDTLLIKAGNRGHGWEFVCTAVNAGDRALIGRRYLVVEVPAKQFITARRLDVVQL